MPERECSVYKGPEFQPNCSVESKCLNWQLIKTTCFKIKFDETIQYKFRYEKLHNTGSYYFEVSLHWASALLMPAWDPFIFFNSQETSHFYP